MKTETIRIATVIDDNYGIDPDDGALVFTQLAAALRNKQTVDLSFENIKMLTTAFLNVAIGQLYGEFTEAFINRHLSYSHLSQSGEVILRRVVEIAKLYYNNPQKLQRILDAGELD